LQLRHLCMQVQKGNADWHGGYYGGYTHIEPDIMENYSHTAAFFKHLGYDLTKDLIPCGITWHMTFGGIRTDNRTMATSIEGLYAPGGCGSRGVGSITYVSYDGTIAADQACERARSVGLPELPEHLVQREHDRVHSRLAPRPPGGLLPAQVKKRVREIMTDKMGYVKSAAR